MYDRNLNPTDLIWLFIRFDKNLLRIQTSRSFLPAGPMISQGQSRLSRLRPIDDNIWKEEFKRNCSNKVFQS